MNAALRGYYEETGDHDEVALCSLCGESICPGDIAEDFDDGQSHSTCADDARAEEDEDHDDEDQTPDGQWVFSTEAGCWIYE